MSFNNQQVELAKEVMNRQNPDLAEKFGTLFSFLVDNPDRFSEKDSKSLNKVGYEEFFINRANKFIHSREPRAPKESETVADEMVSFIINKYFDVPESELIRTVKLHRSCMGAENLVGDILERYIASMVEQIGWVWCSGSIITAIDFIHKKENESWEALQVKNRDNTENSSSSNVRKGTTIQKWFRSFSKKSGENWSKFPFSVNANLSEAGKATLSEAGFKQYVEGYLQKIKEP
jgi:hypothetical protein